MKYFPSGGIKILTVKVAVTADKTVASTATRTTVPIKDLPMPVMLVEGKQPEMMGSRRLNEVLQEQTGLTLTTEPSGAANDTFAHFSLVVDQEVITHPEKALL